MAEFWAFYQQKYRVNAIGLAVIFSPLVILGIWSTRALLAPLLPDRAG